MIGMKPRGGPEGHSRKRTRRERPALEARLLGVARERIADMPVAVDLAPIAPIDDIRATASYRCDAVLTLVKRALAELARESGR